MDGQLYTQLNPLRNVYGWPAVYPHPEPSKERVWTASCIPHILNPLRNVYGRPALTPLG